MKNVRWIIPEAPEPAPVVTARAAASAQATGRRLRIGLLDNTKDNAELLLRLIGERVRQEFDAEVVLRRKGNATLPASPQLLDEMAREADCVLTAMAD